MNPARPILRRNLFATSLHPLFTTLIVMLLTACGSSSNGAGGGFGNSATPDDSPARNPADLCLSRDCGSKELIARIPDAENMIFTDDGRLFVSGSNVFEVVRDANGTFDAVATTAPAAFYGGLAIRDDVLYVNVPVSRMLMASRIGPRGAAMNFVPVHRYEEIGFANGLQLGPDGELYAADGPFPFDLPTTSSIARLTLDPDDPFQVLSEQRFLSFADANLPDGLALDGRTLYFTDTRLLSPATGGPPVATGLIRAVDIQNDGSAGPIRDVVADLLQLFDEVNRVGDNLLVTDFLLGQVSFYDRSGSLLLKSAPLAFEQPSSALIGRPPMFSEDEILVTEKGAPFEYLLPLGNKLVAYRRNP